MDYGHFIEPMQRGRKPNPHGWPMVFACRLVVTQRHGAAVEPLRRRVTPTGRDLGSASFGHNVWG